MSHKHDDYCEQESRITSLEQQVKTIFKQEERLDATLNKLDQTQDELRDAIVGLTKTFEFIKWGIMALLTLLGILVAKGLI